MSKSTKRKDVLLLQSSIERTVKLLADRNIPVHQTGSRAYVSYDRVTLEPEHVVIPVITETSSDMLIEAIHGFIDHEVAHILYSDPAGLVIGSDEGLTYHNIIEDCMIEARSSRDFKNAQRNLIKTSEMVIREINEPAFKKVMEEGGGLFKIWSVLNFSAIRAWAGHTVHIEYMEDKWHHIQGIVDALEDYIPMFANLESTDQTLNLARIIQKRLFGDKPESKPEPGDGDPGPDKPTPDDSDDEPGDGGEPEEGSEPGDGEPEESESEEESDKSSGGDESDIDGTDGDAPTEEGESDSKESDDDSKPESDSESADSSSDNPADAKPSADVTPSVSDVDPDEVESAGIFKEEERPAPEKDDDMTKLLEKIAKSEHTRGRYTPYTRRWDKIEPAPENDSSVNRDRMRAMQESVNSVTGAMRRQVQRMFVSMNRERWEFGKKSGSLSCSDLARLRVSDPRVFKTKEITKTKKTAVSMLIDCSGSMAGREIRVAMESAWAIGEVLDKLGITFELIGFTTDYRPSREQHDDFAKAVSSSDGRYVRFEALYMPIFKDFKEKFTTASKLRMSGQTEGNLRQNIDGECVEIAAARLLRQKEDNKVLIVLSDGSPACSTVDYDMMDKSLKDAVKAVENAGVNVVGIGIADHSVKRYYRKHVVINNTSQLAGVVMKHIGDAVLAR